jgi:hypothetical protein
VLSYRIDGRLVEIRLGTFYELIELRALFKSIRDDPALPDSALLLFDSTARTEFLSDDDVRIRLGILVDILGPHVAGAFAIVVPPAIAGSGRRDQRDAAAGGLRMGIFDDLDSARRWLSTYAQKGENKP